jgi:HupE / UreJ protein
MSTIRRASCVAALVLPMTAAAHSPIAGIGNFYSGALHPLTTPAHLIGLLVVGAVIGQPDRVDRPVQPLDEGAVLAFAVTMMLGLMLHRVAGDPDTGQWLLVLGAAGGLAVAAAWRAPQWLVRGYALAVALCLSLASGPGDINGSARWISLAGTWFGALFSFAYVVVLAGHSARRAATRIALRVVGSWLAAASLLVLALAFAPVRGPVGGA